MIPMNPAIVKSAQAIERRGLKGSVSVARSDVDKKNTIIRMVKLFRKTWI